MLDKFDLKRLLLLDTGSTVHLFMNALLLTNIFISKTPLYLGTNGGVTVCNQKGMYDDLEVWYNPTAMANVLSHGLLADKYRIVEDSAFHSSNFLHKPQLGWMEFVKLGCGLYVYDTSKSVLTNKPSFINYNFV